MSKELDKKISGPPGRASVVRLTMSRREESHVPDLWYSVTTHRPDHLFDRLYQSSGEGTHRFRPIACKASCLRILHSPGHWVVVTYSPDIGVLVMDSLQSEQKETRGILCQLFQNYADPVSYHLEVTLIQQ